MSKRRTSYYFFALLVFFFFCAEIAFSVTTDNQLQQLLLPFNNVHYIKLAYQEKRFSMFLKRPKEYQGYIEYTKPDHFVKEVFSPNRKKIVINNKQLILYRYELDTFNEKEGYEKVSKQIVSLDDYPQFKQLKALFSGLLQGKAAELVRYYRYKIISNSEDKTRLILKSLIVDQFTEENHMSTQHIEVIFHNKGIEKIILFGFNGERSELIIEKIIEQY